jgi:hypothetical protein
VSVILGSAAAIEAFELSWLVELMACGFTVRASSRIDPAQL